MIISIIQICLYLVILEWPRKTTGANMVSGLWNPIDSYDQMWYTVSTSSRKWCILVMSNSAIATFQYYRRWAGFKINHKALISYLYVLYIKNIIDENLWKLKKIMLMFDIPNAPSPLFLFQKCFKQLLPTASLVSVSRTIQKRLYKTCRICHEVTNRKTRRNYRLCVIDMFKNMIFSEMKPVVIENEIQL